MTKVIFIAALGFLCTAQANTLSPARESHIRETIITTKCLNEISLARAESSPASQKRIDQLLSALDQYVQLSIESAEATTLDQKNALNQGATDSWQDLLGLWQQVRPALSSDAEREAVGRECSFE